MLITFIYLLGFIEPFDHISDYCSLQTTSLSVHIYIYLHIKSYIDRGIQVQQV